MLDFGTCCLLSELPSGTRAVVTRVRGGDDAQQVQTVRRLGELGFIPGEPVHLLRRGPGGREPLAVQIGDTQFALRLLEASCIEVNLL
jgi:ferrous iron transport protein A